MRTKYFVFKTKKSEASKAFLIAFLLLGMYHFTQHPILGGLICLVALFFLLTKDGVILDLQNKRYKRARVFGSIAFAPWRTLPELQYVSVFNATMVSSSCSIGGIYVEVKKKIIMINLIYDKNRRLNVYQTLDEAQASENARYIAEKLDLPIYNAISKTWSTHSTELLITG